jgi:hypothetical protein
MKRNLSLISAATGLLLMSLACNITSGDSPQGCAQDVQVAVARGATPLFSWAPACGISSLSVETVPATTGGSAATVRAFTVRKTILLDPRSAMARRRVERRCGSPHNRWSQERAIASA